MKLEPSFYVVHPDQSMSLTSPQPVTLNDDEIDVLAAWHRQQYSYYKTHRKQLKISAFHKERAEKFEATK